MKAASEEELAKGSSITASQQAEELFTSVIKEYAACLFEDHGPTLGDEAERELYELRHLSLGQVAPELHGKTLDGEALKLSSYLGKIVVLNFWHSRCGPCMALIAQERILADRLAGRPFALIGVNSENLADAQRSVAQEKISWRSFCDRHNTTGDPISKTWNVQGWPMTYVLDAKGTIRLKLKGFGPMTTALLDKTIDGLLKEAA